MSVSHARATCAGPHVVPLRLSRKAIARVVAARGRRRPPRVRRVPWIGERRDDLEQFQGRARPAVRHDQWQRIRMTRANMDELNVQPVDGRDELRQRVQRRLCLAPVVVRAPVVDERLELRQLHPLRLIADRFALRPPCRRDTSAEVDEGRLGNLDAIRPDRPVWTVVAWRCRNDGGWRCGVVTSDGLRVERTYRHENADAHAAIGESTPRRRSTASGRVDIVRERSTRSIGFMTWSCSGVRRCAVAASSGMASRSDLRGLKSGP